MVEDQLQFKHRLQRLNRKHAAMGAGYTTVLTKDGLLVPRPKSGFSLGLWPVRALLIGVLAFLAFKILLLSSLGAAEYQARIDRLEGGSQIEQIGALIMTIDPVTRIIVVQMDRVLG